MLVGQPLVYRHQSVELVGHGHQQVPVVEVSPPQLRGGSCPLGAAARDPDDGM